MEHGMSKIMYHYTSQQGYTEILQSKNIRPSLKANNPKDARFGEGQYVSDILPGTKRPSQLSMIFFGIPWAGGNIWAAILRGIELCVLQDFSIKALFLLPAECKIYSDVKNRIY